MKAHLFHFPAAAGLFLCFACTAYTQRAPIIIFSYQYIFQKHTHTHKMIIMFIGCNADMFFFSSFLFIFKYYVATRREKNHVFSEVASPKKGKQHANEIQL